MKKSILNRGLFFSFLTIFITLMVLIILFQYHREKVFRREQLQIQLTVYNRIIHNYLSVEFSAESIEKVLSLLPDSSLRITLIALDGSVVFDSSTKIDKLENHANRPEIKLLQKQQIASDFRHSVSTGIYYYYVAERFPSFYVRTALPYSVSLKSTLHANLFFLYFMGISLVLVIFFSYLITRKVSQSVKEAEHDLKRQLTQNISHELKTPVSSILGYTESILSNPNLEPQKQRFFVERTLNQAERLKTLLQDISILNQFDDARDLYERTSCDLKSIIEEILQDLHLQIEERLCTVSFQVNEELPIFGNKSLLDSIFRNLIDNALAYAGKGVKIKIVLLSNEQRYYHFMLCDSGAGVSEEHLPFLFDRFYRVDKGRSRKLGGTGLGLSIVKNSVHYHNGSISVKNLSTGGLSFIFSLRKY